MRKFGVCEHIPVGLAYSSLSKADGQYQISLFVPFDTGRLSSPNFDFSLYRWTRQRQSLRYTPITERKFFSQQKTTTAFLPRLKPRGIRREEIL